MPKASPVGVEHGVSRTLVHGSKKHAPCDGTCVVRPNRLVLLVMSVLVFSQDTWSHLVLEAAQESADEARTGTTQAMYRCNGFSEKP